MFRLEFGIELCWRLGPSGAVSRGDRPTLGGVNDSHSWNDGKIFILFLNSLKIKDKSCKLKCIVPALLLLLS